VEQAEQELVSDVRAMVVSPEKPELLERWSPMPHG
jgi:hypothetical protein